MANNVRFDSFVTTVLNLDLATQHLSTSLNAKAKPGFLDRFFDWIFGTSKGEKNSIVAQIDALITGNEAALKGFKDRSPQQFDVFKTKLGTLGEKLQRKTDQLDRINFVVKVINHTGSPVIALRLPPAPAPKPVVKAKPAAVAPRKALAPVVAAPVVVVPAQHQVQKVVEGDPKLRVAAQENLDPQVREASAEQVIAAFGRATVTALIASYGQEIAEKVIKHFNDEILNGQKLLDAKGQERIFKMANHYVLNALPKDTSYETLTLFFNTPFTGDFAAEFNAGRNKLSGKGTFAKLQGFSAILPQAKKALGAKVIANLLQNYGWILTNKIFGDLGADISSGKSVEQRRVYAHANAWLLDTFIAKSLPAGMTKEGALSILTGKPVHQIDAEFIKLFRSGEFIISSPTAIADLKKVLKKTPAGNNSSGA